MSAGWRLGRVLNPTRVRAHTVITRLRPTLAERGHRRHADGAVGDDDGDGFEVLDLSGSGDVPQESRQID